MSYSDEHSARQAQGRPLRCGGMSMVEVVLATAVVAVVFVAVLNTVGASRSTLFAVGERARAVALAEGLMAEVVAQPYRDPNYPQTFGPTQDEAATGDRSLFNDVDDYHNWSASPPEDRQGNPLPDAARFERRAEVHFVEADDLQTPVEPDTGIKRVRIIVSRTGEPIVEMNAWRTDGLTLELTP